MPDKLERAEAIGRMAARRTIELAPKSVFKLSKGARRSKLHLIEKTKTRLLFPFCHYWPVFAPDESARLRYLTAFSAEIENILSNNNV